MRASTLVIAAILLTSAFLPAVGARHLSVGSDQVTTAESEETRNDPTVPEDRYNEGTEDPDDCYQPELGASLADEAVGGDSFCGRLVYNHDRGNFQQISTPDQHYPGGQTLDWNGHSVKNLQFDAVRIGSIGQGLSCNSYCLTLIPGLIKPGYVAAWNAMNDAGLADDDGEESFNQDGGSIYFYAITEYPNAAQVVEDQTPVDFDMNGWNSPDGTSWVAFLTADLEDGGDWVADEFSNPNGPEEINEIMLETLILGESETGVDLNGDSDLDEDGWRGDELSSEAVPEICLFTTAFSLSGSSGACQVAFAYDAGETRDPGQAYNDLDYQNPCDSPTFVCSTQGYWRAQRGYLPPGATLFQGNDYQPVHFVVAPTLSECQGQQEPGFAFETPDGADWPYVAHDLDVHTPIATAADVYGTEYIHDAIFPVDTGPVFDAVEDAQDTAEETVEENTPGPVADATSQVVNTANAATFQVAKNDKFEPNAIGDTAQSLFQDERTSGEAADLVRSLDLEKCDIFSSDTETTPEPWVGYIDSQVVRDVSGEFVGDGEDPYLNEDPNQDASNRPGPYMYYTSGYMGMFTDKDDNGNYDPAPIESHFEDPSSFPLFYSHRAKVDESGSAVFDRTGCNYGFFADAPNLSEAIESSGYGVNTTLHQVVYLKEPTTWYSFATQTDAVPFLDGDRFYVLTNNVTQVIIEQATDQTQKAIIESQIQLLINKIAAQADGVDAPDFDITETRANPLGTDDVDDRVELMYQHHDATSEWGQQCSSDTGDFGGQFSFTHDCNALDCSGDAVATGFFLDIAGEGDNPGATLGTGLKFKPFDPDGDGTPFDFDGWAPPSGGIAAGDTDTGVGFHLIDVDPMDNDPAQTLEEDGSPCATAHHEEARVECAEKVDDVSADGSLDNGFDITWSAVKEEASEDDVPGEITYIVERSAENAAGDVFTATFSAADPTTVSDDLSDTSGTLVELSYTVTAQYEYGELTVPSRLGITSNAATPLA